MIPLPGAKVEVTEGESAMRGRRGLRAYASMQASPKNRRALRWLWTRHASWQFSTVEGPPRARGNT